MSKLLKNGGQSSLKEANGIKSNNNVHALSGNLT